MSRPRPIVLHHQQLVHKQQQQQKEQQDHQEEYHGLAEDEDTGPLVAPLLGPSLHRGLAGAVRQPAVSREHQLQSVSGIRLVSGFLHLFQRLRSIS